MPWRTGYWKRIGGTMRTSPMRRRFSRLGNEAGVDAARLLAAANSGEVQAIYRSNTAEAIERSVFGSPTYFVDGDMFYGQDHLELVARALVKPFSGTWPLPAA